MLRRFLFTLNQQLMAKPICPGLKHITLEEATILARVSQEEGDDPKRTAELLTCIDDCLGIQNSAKPIDDRCEMVDALEGRITQADIPRKTDT